MEQGGGVINNLLWFLLSWSRDLFLPRDALLSPIPPGGLATGLWQSLKTGTSRSLSSCSFGPA